MVYVIDVQPLLAFTLMLYWLQDHLSQILEGPLG